MSGTLLPLLSSAPPPSAFEDVASHLAESSHAVSRGFELSAAAVVDRLFRQTEDAAAMRRVFDAACQLPANTLSSVFNKEIPTTQNIPWLSSAQNLTTSLFGENRQVVLLWLSCETGLKAAAASTVLNLSTLSVLDRLGARVRQRGMTAASLAIYLQSERATIHNALHPELHRILSSPSSASPVIAQTVERNQIFAQGIEKAPSLIPWLSVVVASEESIRVLVDRVREFVTFADDFLAGRSRGYAHRDALGSAVFSFSRMPVAWSCFAALMK